MIRKSKQTLDLPFNIEHDFLNSSYAATQITSRLNQKLLADLSVIEVKTV